MSFKYVKINASRESSPIQFYFPVEAGNEWYKKLIVPGLNLQDEKKSDEFLQKVVTLLRKNHDLGSPIYVPRIAYNAVKRQFDVLTASADGTVRNFNLLSEEIEQTTIDLHQQSKDAIEKLDEAKDAFEIANLEKFINKASPLFSGFVDQLDRSMTKITVNNSPTSKQRNVEFAPIPEPKMPDLKKFEYNEEEARDFFGSSVIDFENEIQKKYNETKAQLELYEKLKAELTLISSKTKHKDKPASKRKKVKKRIADIEGPIDQVEQKQEVKEEIKIEALPTLMRRSDSSNSLSSDISADFSEGTRSLLNGKTKKEVEKDIEACGKNISELSICETHITSMKQNIAWNSQIRTFHQRYKENQLLLAHVKENFAWVMLDTAREYGQITAKEIAEKNGKEKDQKELIEQFNKRFTINLKGREIHLAEIDTTGTIKKVDQDLTQYTQYSISDLIAGIAQIRANCNKDASLATRFGQIFKDDFNQGRAIKMLDDKMLKAQSHFDQFFSASRMFAKDVTNQEMEDFEKVNHTLVESVQNKRAVNVAAMSISGLPNIANGYPDLMKKIRAEADALMISVEAAKVNQECHELQSFARTNQEKITKYKEEINQFMQRLAANGSTRNIAQAKADLERDLNAEEAKLAAIISYAEKGMIDAGVAVEKIAIPSVDEAFTSFNSAKTCLQEANSKKLEFEILNASNQNKLAEAKAKWQGKLKEAIVQEGRDIAAKKDSLLTSFKASVVTPLQNDLNNQVMAVMSVGSERNVSAHYDTARVLIETNEKALTAKIAEVENFVRENFYGELRGDANQLQEDLITKSGTAIKVNQDIAEFKTDMSVKFTKAQQELTAVRNGVKVLQDIEKQQQACNLIINIISKTDFWHQQVKYAAIGGGKAVTTNNAEIKLPGGIAEIHHKKQTTPIATTDAGYLVKDPDAFLASVKSVGNACETRGSKKGFFTVRANDTTNEFYKIISNIRTDNLDSSITALTQFANKYNLLQQAERNRNSYEN